MAIECGTFASMILRVVTRTIHVLASLILLTVLFLECFFDIDKDAVYENLNFKRMISFASMGLIASGILMISLMKRKDALPP